MAGSFAHPPQHVAPLAVAVLERQRDLRGTVALAHGNKDVVSPGLQCLKTGPGDVTYLRHMTRTPRFDTFKNTGVLIICPKPLHKTKSMEFRFQPYSEK